MISFADEHRSKLSVAALHTGPITTCISCRVFTKRTNVDRLWGSRTKSPGPHDLNQTVCGQSGVVQSFKVWSIFVSKAEFLDTS